MYPAALQDLNIDLNALASSLSVLPIETVLDIDACHCLDFMSISSAAEEPSTFAASTLEIAGSTEHAADLSNGKTDDRSGSATDPETSAGNQSASHALQHDAQHPTPTHVAAGSHASASTSKVAAATANAAVAPASAAVEPARKMENDHDLELDAILNVQDSQILRPTSTVIQQPVTQEQESLEDWLDSL